jgi:hypothetical protein
MPLQATSGAASYDAFGGGVPAVPTFVEDVFSCFLYTGNDSTQTITNGIDLSTKGGLVWMKSRTDVASHALYDTVRGATQELESNSTGGQTTRATGLTAFNSNGFSISSRATINSISQNYASWTFRKQPKFFDVVTWTGTGVDGQVIPHSLGVKPAVIIVKRTDTTSNWQYNDANDFYLLLNSTDASAGANRNGGWIPQYNTTATTLTTQNYSGNSNVNASGGTYVAYLFAHNAGGFGLTGTDNVISCGSFTTSGGGGDATVDLGYEPQWLLVKSASGTSGWDLIDNMRGMPNLGGYGTAVGLEANNSNAEGSRNPNCFPTATGFYYARAASTTYIYIAIRRGPMKVPTSGTSVFSQTLTSSNANPLTITTNFPVDMTINRYTGESSNYVFDRLRGANASAAGGTATYLKTEATSAEAVIGTIGDNMQSNTTLIDRSLLAGTSDPKIYYSFRRAPSFFDEVCYKGNGSTQTITHNLGVVPELIIGKNRTTTGNNWPVLFNFASTTMNYGFLNLTNSCPNDTYANVGVFSAAPTSTSMFLVNSGSMNTNTNQHIAYLFATCAGVSKVFSYTGNGSSQTINCGFTGGARFVLIKRTDSTGDWYVWDSARGIVSGNDPHLSLNTTAAEVTTDDTIDTDSTGFVVNQVSATDVNVSSATYIGLAIA